MMTMVRSDSLGRLPPAPFPSWSGTHAPRWASCGGPARIVRIFTWALLLAALWHGPVQAQNAQNAPAALLEMVNTLTADGVFQFDALERAAAAANDNAYLKLQKICTPLPTGAPPPTCTGSTLTLWDRLRELEGNANELLGRGVWFYSLRLNPEGMSDALRWTAPEEYSAQGSLSTKFVNGQTSVLANRFSALRFASQGIPVAQGGSISSDGNGQFSYTYNGVGARGGAAGADSIWSRLSVFVNGAFGTGEKAPTTFEDAFFFDSTDVSAGADLRLNDHIVVGVLLGHTEKRVDFDSARSIVDGGIRGNGQSAMAYMQYETDSAYVNLALGTQHLSLATRRRITYPSNNPEVPSVDVTSYSNTGSTALIGTLGGGYTFHYKAFSAEPYINVQAVRTRINGFTEFSNDGFDIDTPEQTIQSLEGSIGARFHYVINTRLGVIVPYAFAEARHQFRDSSRDIDSGYSADGGGTDFVLPTDPPVRNYYAAGGGGSVVLKHGLQAYIQYLRVLDYTNYTDHTVSGGLRLEF